jgi:pterin binding enzyme
MPWRTRTTAISVRRVPSERPAIEDRFPSPSVMGVVNVTPDSFSDGGAHLEPTAAVAAARRMLDEGAAIVDVGGESTRPGSEGVPVDEELRRVVPVLEELDGAPVSIDTAKAEVARRALELGAELVNDVTALRADPGMVGVVAESDAYLCLMHMQGEPRTMQVAPSYGDVVAEVASFLESRLAFAVAASASTRASASGRPSSRTSSSCGGSTRSRRWAGPSSSASRARALSDGSSAARRQPRAPSQPASRPPCRPSTTEPRSYASMTFESMSRR